MIKKIAKRRDAFTLVEMLVVIAIILAIAALAAAFAPRVNDNQNLTRAVDNLEQWLLTAKMRAKRDGLATGVRFVSSGDAPGTYSQLQYIQQPDPLSGGMCVTSSTAGAYPYPPGGTIYYTGGLCTGALNGIVSFVGVDFSLGGAALAQPLVEPGDFLEIRDGGVYQVAAAASPTTLQLLTAGVAGSYDNSLSLSTPTTNYRILRQPRILIGEEPLMLPNNFAVNMGIIPDTIIPNNSTTTMTHWSNVAPGPSGSPEILFSPTGSVVGTNAGTGIIVISVYDTTMNPFDINRVGIVSVQSRTGFIGGYSAAAGAGLAGYNPFTLVVTGRESGL